MLQQVAQQLERARVEGVGLALGAREQQLRQQLGRLERAVAQQQRQLLLHLSVVDARGGRHGRRGAPLLGRRRGRHGPPAVSLKATERSTWRLYGKDLAGKYKTPSGFFGLLRKRDGDMAT